VVEAALVGLHDQQVGGVLDGDQPVGVLALGMQGIGGDHPPGQVQPVQQGTEPADLVGLAPPRRSGPRHDGWFGPSRPAGAPAGCGGGRRRAGSCRRWRPPAAMVGVGDVGLAGGGGWAASQAPIARSRASASIRARTRRTVASPGGRQTPVRWSRRTPSGQHLAGHVAGPLADRDQGSWAGQHRGYGHGQHRGQRVPSAASVAWVGDLGEVAEQVTALLGCQGGRPSQPMGGRNGDDGGSCNESEPSAD
jgi:hypothetical protein